MLPAAVQITLSRTTGVPSDLALPVFAMLSIIMILYRRCFNERDQYMPVG